MRDTFSTQIAPAILDAPEPDPRALAGRSEDGLFHHIGKSAAAQEGNGLIDGALVPQQTRMRCAKHDVIGHAL